MRYLLALIALAALTASAQQSTIGKIGGALVTYLYTDTNTVYVATAGTANANGTYSLKSRVGTVECWTNANGISGLIHNPGDIDTYQITNSAAVEWYSWSSGPPIGWGASLASWAVNSGAGPAPSVTFGTNTLNTPILVSATQVPITIQSNILFVATNGNNSTAVKGRLDLPWKNLSNAVSNAVAGDVIELGYGFFDESVWANNSLPSRLVIRGKGADNTVIHGLDGAASAVSFFYMGSSNVFSDFTATNFFFYGGAAVNSTNPAMYRIRASAAGDVVVLQNTSYGFIIEDCDFGGNSDKIADLSATAPGGVLTNFTLIVKNTTITGGAGQDGNGLNLGDGAATGWLNKQFSGVYSTAGSNSVVLHTVTNYGLTLPKWTLAPILYRTNFISGQFYTNVYSEPIFISGSITNVQAAVAGTTMCELWCFAQTAANVAGFTNFFGAQTVAGSTATTNGYGFSAWIPSAYVFCITNRAGGAGNATSPRGGQLYLP